MEYGYKTLILIDNSSSVTPGNREIVKETLKYLIKNSPEGDEYALATYSNQTELLVDYGAKSEEYMQAIDKITYTDKVTCLSDVLMDTVISWKESDFAMRNIILFTDGQMNESETYPIEEVYFTLNENGFPLYVVGLNQQTNQGLLKNVAALARISHGEIFYSDFEDSEADVEIKLTEKLLKAMNEKRSITEGTNNEEEETVSSEIVSEVGEEEGVYKEDYESDVYAAEYQNEILEESLVKGETAGSDYMPLYVIGGVIVAAFILIIAFGKIKRRSRSDRANTYDGICDSLNGGRRFLSVVKTGEMTLEDMNNPMMYFKLPPFEHITLGSSRTEADIAINNDEGIESRHCEINYHFGKYYVRDLKTMAGTYLNGERLNNETELRSSDVISLGHAKLMVKLS